MNPKAPIWNKNKMTARPKRLHVWKVSTTVNPVTQVAENDVNIAVKKGTEIPLRDETGKRSRIVPIAIITKKPNMIILAGLMEVLLV